MLSYTDLAFHLVPVMKGYTILNPKDEKKTRKKKKIPKESLSTKQYTFILQRKLWSYA